MAESPVSHAEDSPANSFADADGIETTDEEKEGFHIIRAICAKHLDVNRVAIRDTKSYCGVLLDDNNRKPICRLRFNFSKKYLGLFDSGEEVKYTIESISEIYRFEDQLIRTINLYEKPQIQGAKPGNMDQLGTVSDQSVTEDEKENL